jgi:hypothetical protein
MRVTAGTNSRRSASRFDTISWTKKIDPGDVAAWSVESGDEAEFDRVVGDPDTARFTQAFRNATPFRTPASAAPLLIKAITSIAGCCACTACGHATAAPPSSVMNSRRLTSSMGSPPDPPLPRGSCHSSVFTCQYQGVSLAEWPKDKHEYASTETGVISGPLTAVGIERAPPRVTGLSQREKKL